MNYQIKVKLVLGIMLGTIIVVLLLARTTTKWQGPLVIATIDNVTATNKTISIKVDERIEVGLRSDGVVVWRNKE